MSAKLNNHIERCVLRLSSDLQYITQTLCMNVYSVNSTYTSYRQLKVEQDKITTNENF